MKYKISFLIITIISASVHMHAAEKPSPAWGRAGDYLRRARGVKPEDIPQPAETASLPTLQAVIDPEKSEATFMNTLQGFLRQFTGCITWHDSCACPSWDKPMSYNDKEKVSGFDEPITCECMLSSCYQKLQGCSQEGLNMRLIQTLEEPGGDPKYPQRRCKIIALVCQGANPNIRKKYGTTALYEAVLHSDFYLVKFLLEHGADPNIRNGRGTYPLLPQTCKTALIAKELLKYGADVNAKQLLNMTALHWAMHDSYHDNDGELSRVLLEHGAEADAQDDSGRTPLSELAGHCHYYSSGKYGPDASWLVIKKAQLLLAAGANPHHRIQAGYRAGKTVVEIAQDSDAKVKHIACKAFVEFLQHYEQRPNRKS